MNVQASEAYRQLIKQELNRKKNWMEKYGREQAKEERQMIIQTLQREKERQERMKAMLQDPVRKMLYDGVSKEGKGRLAYLSEQRKKSPVKKYHRPMTSSQEVGWLLDSENEYSKKYHTETAKYSTQHGRKAVIRDTFLRKGGVN